MRRVDPNGPLKQVLLHCAAGIAAGWTLVAIFLAYDFAGLGTMVFASELWLSAVCMLLVVFAVTFGSVGFAHGVWVVSREE